VGRLFLSPPDVGGRERRLLLDAFDSNWIAPVGPHLDAFEVEFAALLGTREAVALSSGTAALQLALVLLGVGPGDDVIVRTFTFVASANAARYLGACPVLLDSEQTSWNIDPGLLHEELAERARRGNLPAAVVAVDGYGQCADWDPILAVCAQYEVPVVEDAAEALGGDLPPSTGGNARAHRHVLIQWEQDHHDERWWDARRPRSGLRPKSSISR
jgi:dTDP-4-amino-4,6-dideoxygalactose transaminase